MSVINLLNIYYILSRIIRNHLLLLIIKFGLQKLMQYSPQQFITAYQNLSIPTLSRQANQTLLKIERSSEAWEIAKKLILDDSKKDYGSQILSKKLSVYSQEIQNRCHIGQFIIELNNLNKSLIYCYAKWILHMGLDNIQLGKHTNQNNLIQVLSALPIAAVGISLEPQQDPSDNQKTRTKKLFENYKNFLIQSFKSFPLQVALCIQNYSQNNYKIHSEQLIRLLLTRPLSQINTTLQKILLQQKYETLTNQIYSYLITNQKNSNISQFLVVFVAFARSLNLLTLQPSILSIILSKVLQIIKKQNLMSIQIRSNYSLISDSFDLWSNLSLQISKVRMENIISPQINVCKQAFVQLWRIVVQRSLENQIPKFTLKTKQQSLCIDLEDDDGLPVNSYEEVDNSNKFRNAGQSFIHMCFSVVANSQDHKNICLKYIYNLTQQTILQLELAIFVMSHIVQIASQNAMPQIGAIFQSIVKSQYSNNPYIWQQIISLIGKFGHGVVCQGKIFKTALLVLKQSYNLQQLSTIATQNFYQVLSICQNSQEKAAQTPILQQFFQFLFQNVYYKTTNSTTFEILTKTIIIFIYHFKPDLNVFQNYLKSLNAKIQSVSEPQRKLQIFGNLSLGHVFIPDQISMKFTPMLSQFLVAFLPAAVAYIQTIPPNQLSYPFKFLGEMLSVGGGYNTEIWVEFLRKLSTLPNVVHSKSHLIELINKFYVVSQYDKNIYINILIPFLMQAQPFVISSFQSSKKDDYKLIKVSLYFYFNLLEKYVDKLSNFNPDPLLLGITEKVLKDNKYQFDSLRLALAIIRKIMTKGYRVQELLQFVLKRYPRLQDNLWKSIQPIIYEAYKYGGQQIYKATFVNIFPQILPPNPLFNGLMRSIEKSEIKAYKNIFLQIK